MSVATHIRAFVLILFGGVGLFVSAQTYSPPSGPLYQMYFAKQAYFDSIHAFTPDSIFYHEGGEYAEFQKFMHKWEPRLAPHGDFEVYNQLMRNYNLRQAHGAGGSSFRSDEEDPWQEIGPKRRTLDMIGIGPIRKIAINKTNADHMLCSSSSGGMFYTTNAGASWDNAGTDVGWPHSGCQCPAYYPGTTDQWYGISAVESFRANSLAYVGGIFRKTGAGESWEKIGDQADFAGPSTETEKLLFDEKLNDIGDHRLFLASTQGLYVSDNPAASDPADVTWALVDTINYPPSFDALTSPVLDPIVKCFDIEY